MRRLSMKSKRRKSETTSDSGSEENGVAHPTTGSNEEMKEEKENEELETSVSERTQSPRKAAAKKRPSRGRHSQKAISEEAGGESHNEDGTQAADTEDEENGNVGKGGTNKRRKKEDQVASTSNQDTADTEKEYEVEKIVGQRTIKGRRQFLVRWKGYGEDSDTWEHEKDLNCLKLIEEFLAEDTDNEHDIGADKPGKTAKNKPLKTEKKSKKPKVVSKKQSENDIKPVIKSEDDIKTQKDSQKEFEVEKILEVRFKKNKTRDFLIRWKGFSSADDTWEPEENLNCPELIEKFMQKVEKAKTADMRELRANRAHTKRYTLTTHESGRRLSRRNMDKQRATYHECDE